MINKVKLIKFGVLIFAFSAVLLTAFRAGQENIQAKWDKRQVEMLNNHLDAIRKAQAKQTKLNTEVEQFRGRYEQNTAKLNATIDNLNNELLNRIERPVGVDRVPEASTAQPNTSRCTGRELYRDDARLLIREAKRAEILRNLLKQCRNAYKSLQG